MEPTLLMDAEATITAWHCLICGEVVDALIVARRERPPLEPYGTCYDTPVPSAAACGGRRDPIALPVPIALQPLRIGKLGDCIGVVGDHLQFIWREWRMVRRLSTG